MSRNPFRPTRVDYMHKPLLWLSPRARSLEEERSVYVCGTRGSGKTSLLRALHWQERLHNETLKAQMGDEKSRFLSVYFRLPDHLSNGFGELDWSQIVGPGYNIEAAGFRYFSYLMEFTAGYLICEAVEEHRKEGVLHLTARRAYEFVQNFLKDYRDILDFSDSTVDDFYSLSKLLKTIAELIAASTWRGNVNEMLRRLPPKAPGVMIHDIASLAANIFKSQSENDDFHIKICVDDCEMLTLEQQRSINTLVRLAKSPLFWTISYAHQQFQPTQGFYQDQNLTSADRNVVDLDSESSADFRRLCEAVASLRLCYSSQNRYIDSKKPVDQQFNLDRVLGPFDTNRLLEEANSETISDSFEVLKESARRYMVAMGMKFPGGDSRKGRLPIYEAYLAGKLENVPPVESLAALTASRKKRISAYLRRKQVGAMLAIVHDMRLRRIPYAGAEVIIGLSDGCIRDFLELMAEIFDAMPGPENRVLSLLRRVTPLPTRVQREGVYRSAEMKFEGIRANSDQDGAEVSKLVECLGALLGLLHREIKTAERGVFVISSDEMTASCGQKNPSYHEAVKRVIGRAVSDGLIRTDGGPARDDEMSDGPVSPWKIRLHRRFAGMFGYSFRGPYGEIDLPQSYLFDICNRPSAIDAHSWARDVYLKLQDKDPRQEGLPL